MQSSSITLSRRLVRRPSQVMVVREQQDIESHDQRPRLVYRAARRAFRLSKRLAFFFLPPVIYQALKMSMPRVVQDAQARQLLRQALARRLGRVSDQVGVDPAQCHEQFARYRDLHLMRENSPASLKVKREVAAWLFNTQLHDRARLLRELARLASLDGQELLGCAYRVRAMRLLGADVYHDLPLLRSTLERFHFAGEAEALAAMYEDPAIAPARCQKFLENALAAHRRPPKPIAFERIEDRRHAAVPRVAVIVSLYNAADKLSTFLHAIRCQSLIREQQVELIFVDSGSPADEYGALTQTLANFSLPYLYVRTAGRESIQTAWNRGISLARAEYLSFLGVDETVTPDALSVLAEALDSDPSLDWVEGDSLLTEVDAKGSWTRDIMTYDRAGYTANHVYLETCYLSWVGAMYRRSIHERFGYYDGSFRATGDNEFKCRVLPFVKTQRLPQLLGLFVNYPEPRATGSPVAELEDIRAWYLNKTLGGVRYAMQRRDPCEIEKLLLLSLRYRKSYTTHVSSDIEYAAHVAAYLRERLPNSPLIGLIPGITRLLKAMRLHDHAPLSTRSGFEQSVADAHASLAAVQAEHTNTPWVKGVGYAFSRDNRHEQHAFLY